MTLTLTQIPDPTLLPPTLTLTLTLLQVAQSERKVLDGKLAELQSAALVAADEVPHYKTEYDESVEQARRTTSPSYHPCRHASPPRRPRGAFGYLVITPYRASRWPRVDIVTSLSPPCQVRELQAQLDDLNEKHATLQHEHITLQVPS